ncbi:MAG: glycoside hydrolase family 2 protein, partial [Oscillospiraceae bacterium]|nr:glycoside hydrolase family 2 protein [Oscillospiraceae bacterium]
MRTILSLNDNWKFYKSARPGDAKGEPVTLPHTWNAVDGQDGGNDYYRGTCWYIRQLEKPETDGEVWLEFAGAAMT